VCIANWNCRDLLRDCLRSLLRQPQGVPLEVIVVDNASSDGAPEMAAEEFPEVVLIRNDRNRGFGAASNQAAALARSPYLFFLNNDTLVPPGTLGQLVEYAEAHPEAGIIGPRLCDGTGRTQVSCRPRPTAATFLHRTSLLRWTGLLRRGYHQYRREVLRGPSGARAVEILMGAAMLVPRRLFFAVGRWDEAYTFGGEDFDLSTRIGRRQPLHYVPEVSVVHYSRSSTRLNVAYSAPNVAIGFARYLRKSGASRPAMFVYKLIVTLDAPLQLAVKGTQYAWRKLWRRADKAQNSLQRVQELWYFLSRGLWEFWRV